MKLNNKFYFDISIVQTSLTHIDKIYLYAIKKIFLLTFDLQIQSNNQPSYITSCEITNYLIKF